MHLLEFWMLIKDSLCNVDHSRSISWIGGQQLSQWVPDSGRSSVVFLSAAEAPASQFHRLLASFLIVENSSIFGDPVHAWEKTLAQPRFHLLNLPKDSCIQSIILLKLAGGFCVLNQGVLTNWGSHKFLHFCVFVPWIFFLFSRLWCM